MNSAQFSDYHACNLTQYSSRFEIGEDYKYTNPVRLAEFHVSESILLTNDEGQFVLWCQIYNFQSYSKRLDYIIPTQASNYTRIYQLHVQ